MSDPGPWAHAGQEPSPAAFQALIEKLADVLKHHDSLVAIAALRHVLGGVIELSIHPDDWLTIADNVYATLADELIQKRRERRN
jgi:hypothetical protein